MFEHSSSVQRFFFFFVGKKCPNDSHLFHSDVRDTPHITFFTLNRHISRLLILPMNWRHNEGQPPLGEGPTHPDSVLIHPTLFSTLSSFMLNKAYSGETTLGGRGALLEKEEVSVEHQQPLGNGRRPTLLATSQLNFIASKLLLLCV